MAESPILSVCIPVFNPGPYLSIAISSVLSQEFTDYELILVDDCSREPVESIVSGFKDPRIQYHQNSSNLGLVRNWNRCLDLSKGKYIAIFHQDDLMLPENLRAKVNSLELHDEVGAVYSDIYRINEQGKVIGGHYIQQPNQDQILYGHQIYKMVSETGNPIACPSVVFRRECVDLLGNFDPQYKFAVDLEMWMRIALNYSFFYINRPLIMMRVHERQETFKVKKAGDDYRDVFNTYKNVYSRVMPEEYYKYAKPTFITLKKQSVGMFKWLFKQGNVRLSLNYLLVGIQSWLMANRQME